MLTGENGLLNKAEDAVNKTEESNIKETISILINEWRIENALERTTLEDFLNKKVGTEIDSVEKSENNFIVKKDGYQITITADGELIEINLDEENWNILDDYTPELGKYLNGDTQGTGEFVLFRSIPVEPNTKYFFGNDLVYSDDMSYGCRFLNLRTSDKTLIKVLSYGNYEKYCIVPENCYFIDITFQVTDTDNYIDPCFFTANENFEELKPTTPVSTQKPTFIFTFDDGTDGDINIKELFDTYGFKCGFALLANSALESKKERYLGYESDGFEILSHSTDGMGMITEQEVSDIDTKLKVSKEILESSGFNINGFVTPSTWLRADALESVGKYYSFGFGHLDGNPSGKKYHTSLYSDIRQLDRVSLQSEAPDTLISYIDECINNNGIMILYGHSYPSNDYMTEENMNRYLAYLKEKSDNKEIYVLPPTEGIETYYGLKISSIV